MKKINLLLLLLICLFIINVNAAMESPQIIAHKVMVTNKNGTNCYEDGKKTDKVIPYGTTLEVNRDISGSYIYVSNSDYSCNVKYSDVSSKTQSFDLNSTGVEKITTTKAIILASGLNMRKGPAVTYTVITTIPKNSIVTLTHLAGTYWYYGTYNGKSGWITAMNGYVGFERKQILYSYQPMKIYSTYDKKAVLGTIPANTEIVNYLELGLHLDTKYYIQYNGIKGYVESMFYKTEEGVIKLLKDVEIRDQNDKLVKKLTTNQELKYNMVDEDGKFYLPDKKEVVYIPTDSFKYIKEGKVLKKQSGYIGEGVFGEEKLEKTGINEEEEENSHSEETKIIVPKQEKKQSSISTKEIIVICLLTGIFLSLTALVIIKLVNSKKKTTNLIKSKTINTESVVNSEYENEIEKARKVIAKRISIEANNNEVKSNNEFDETIKNEDNREV